MPYQPSEKEQEYFLREEMERLRRLREEARQRREAEERQKLKELHWMHCPKCGTEMSMTSMHSIEVELCPGCGGIFLDAGELDKVLEEQSRGGFAAALKSLRRWWKE
ncbi:MAG TPA: zf-TFIIB domain-containing protein [Thermoanaerobaculaceae bacterium]|nr:zf-TFIIB domain-containing protein [Thermoanaerobaculaceae bacterium]HRS16528.1 zf-TFIIB domain-containing protein [Thermoanaerobaculaceae bacterium]